MMAKDIPAGYVLCDVCGGVLYPRDAPRHSTHTAAEVAAVRGRREPKRDLEAEAAEQAS